MRHHINFGSFVSIMRRCCVLGLVFALVGCSLFFAPSLDQPQKVIVYSGETASEFVEGDPEYATAYALLKGVRLCDVLEKAVEQNDGLKAGKCIEFVYDQPRYTEGEGSQAREYDCLLFCFAGAHPGEVILGLNGEYKSGTYRMGGKAWPFA